MARRDDEVVSVGYAEEEQRSQPGCSGDRLASYFGDGTLVFRDGRRVHDVPLTER